MRKKYFLDDVQIILYLKNNLSCAQIAKIYNIDQQIIQRFVRKLILPDDIYLKRKPNNKPLSENEFNVLVGGLLGDTWIGYTKKSKNCCGSFTHKIEHEEYVIYKYNFLKRLCQKPTVHNKKDKRSNRNYKQAFCKIATNPLLNEIAEKFYKNGKKVVDEELISKLTPLGLAIWYMDDGSKTNDGYKFSTDCFIKEDRYKLVKLLNKFNLDCTYPDISKQIYIKKNSCDKFTKLIKDFIPICMKYKLHKI